MVTLPRSWVPHAYTISLVPIVGKPARWLYSPVPKRWLGLRRISTAPPVLRHSHHQTNTSPVSSSPMKALGGSRPSLPHAYTSTKAPSHGFTTTLRAVTSAVSPSSVGRLSFHGPLAYCLLPF